MIAAICDDCKQDIQQVVQALKEYVSMTNITLTWDTFDNGEALLASNQSYDFIILDIQLQQAFGFEVARQLIKKHPTLKILYYSNNIEYSPDSFEAHAFGFLLKPLQKDKLFRRIDRIAYQHLKDRITFMDRDKIRQQILVHDIQHIEAHGRKTSVITTHKTFEVNQTLTGWTETLKTYHFALCQRGILVNLHAIENLTIQNEIVLHNKQTFHLTRDIGRIFKDRLLSYWGEFYV